MTNTKPFDRTYNGDDAINAVEDRMHLEGIPISDHATFDRYTDELLSA